MNISCCPRRESYPWSKNVVSAALQTKFHRLMRPYLCLRAVTIDGGAVTGSGNPCFVYAFSNLVLTAGVLCSHVIDEEPEVRWACLNITSESVHI